MHLFPSPFSVSSQQRTNVPSPLSSNPASTEGVSAGPVVHISVDAPHASGLMLFSQRLDPGRALRQMLASPALLDELHLAAEEVLDSVTTQGRPPADLERRFPSAWQRYLVLHEAYEMRLKKESRTAQVHRHEGKRGRYLQMLQRRFEMEYEKDPIIEAIGELIRQQGHDFHESLEALEGYGQTLDSDAEQLLKALPEQGDALELLRCLSLHKGARRVAQAAEDLQLALGRQLRSQLRLAAQGRQPDIERIVEAMHKVLELAQIRSSWDAALGLIARCEQRGVTLHSEPYALAEIMLDTLAKSPDATALSTLGARLVPDPRAEQRKTLFAELANTLQHDFAVSTWFDPEERTQVLSTLRTLSTEVSK